MCQRTFSWVVAVMIWAAVLFRFTDSGVYTSSKKVSDMVLLEEHFLNNLHSAVTDLGNETASSIFLTFYRDRMWKVKERQIDADLLESLKHPNGIYHSIKQFATEYQNIRSVLESTQSYSIQKYLSSVANQADIAGARLSFLRLQRVYGLNASDMVKGNYLGFPGPELTNIDALEIGQAAFTEGRLETAVAWLQESLAISGKKEPSAGFGDAEGTFSVIGRILALLGRVYVRQGDYDKTEEMYRRALIANPTDVQVTELEQDIQSKPPFKEPSTENTNFNRLCTMQNKLTTDKFDPRIKCSYRIVIVPYYRFKQELVSISPYVTLFYDVITDFEIENIIDSVEEKLQRGQVEVDGATIHNENRISDLSWVYDTESQVAARLSKRIGAITNLVVEPFQPGRAFSSEAFQVVNYGMGGHYCEHYDIVDAKSQNDPRTRDMYKYGGNRLATFLIYLTDVERGGATVFQTADIAVSPVKKMALFWYGWKPSGQWDHDTKHAGCPVVIGHKWITNKWIWIHSNAFTRPCGLTENATQLDIDQYMSMGWA